MPFVPKVVLETEGVVLSTRILVVDPTEIVVKAAVATSKVIVPPFKSTVLATAIPSVSFIAASTE